MTSFKVDLPMGSSSLLHGMTFAGSPPVLKAIDPSSSLARSTDDILLHWYAQTLSVDNIEYSYIADTHTLEELLQQFCHVPGTQLTLYKTPMIGPPQVTLTLPAGKDIDIDVDGFPPVVSHVAKSSMWHAKVPKGFVVDRLILHSGELSLASGGFTASNVNRAIAESSSEQGRIMVLKKVTPKGDVTSSSRPFDWGAFVNDSKWSLKRVVFGVEEKASTVKKGAGKSLD